MRHFKTILLIVTALTLSLSSCKSQKKKTENSEVKSEGKALFTQPQIPSLMTDPKDQVNFFVQNFWKGFNFSDTTIMNRQDEIDQIFASFVTAAGYADKSIYQGSVNSMLDSSMKIDSTLFSYFFEQYDKFLYDPHSSYMDGELLIPVLQYVIQSDKISDLDKIRPEDMLERLSKNRVGAKAADFAYTLASEATGKLSTIKADYIILFFNNPECMGCAQVKRHISGSTLFNSFFYNPKAGDKTVKILAIYPGKDFETWRTESYPEKWINAYDPTQAIDQKELYDLRVSPVLYLLDKEKNVLLKDAPIEQIEEWLQNKIGK